MTLCKDCAHIRSKSGGVWDNPDQYAHCAVVQDMVTGRMAECKDARLGDQCGPLAMEFRRKIEPHYA